jgi:signal transduction histidine kinase
LQQRIARYISITVGLSLIVSAVALVLLRHRFLSHAMEESARTYTELLALPVASEVETFRSAGHGRLIPMVNRWIRLNPDATRLWVVHVDGGVYLEASRSFVQTYAEWERAPRLDDPWLREAILGIEVSSRRVKVPRIGAVFRVVAPVVEELGRRRVSVVVEFSYDRVNNELLAMIGVLALVLGASVLAAQRVAVVLAGSITRSLERLLSGVRRAQEGRVDERVEVGSNDEIQVLADAFNAMADQQQQTIERLREANRELESLDQAKADLLANVSHELRTPLTALRGYLELLAGGELGEMTDRAARAVEVCQQNLRRLSSRIEELFQVSNIDQGARAEYLRKPIHLGQLLHGIAETCLPRMQERQLVCTLNLEPELPPVSGDWEQLERAFLNIVDNAVKFSTKGGSIRLSAEAEQHEGRDGVLVRVADSGVGIPQDQLVRIFDRFYQVDPSVRRRYGGMGLGLSFVRSIVEAHEGVVWVESEKGLGATFLVWLPWHEGGTPPPPSEESVERDGDEPGS